MLQFIKGDIQSGDLLSYILETEKIDTVMHFAAQVSLHAEHAHSVHTHHSISACLTIR